MSAKTNDGGTAFPMQDPQAIHIYALAQVEGITDTDERDRAYTAARALAVGGMTMRDYFAAKAMQAYFTDPNVGFGSDVVEAGARAAYRIADAMLKAREGGAA